MLHGSAPIPLVWIVARLGGTAAQVLAVAAFSPFPFLPSYTLKPQLPTLERSVSVWAARRATSQARPLLCIAERPLSAEPSSPPLTC